MKMKKQWIAFLLSCTMAAGIFAEGIRAEEIRVGEIQAEASYTEEIQTEEMDAAGTHGAETKVWAEETSAAEAYAQKQSEEEAPNVNKDRAEDDRTSRTGYRPMICLEPGPDELPEVYEPSSNWADYKRSAVYRHVWDSYSSNYYYNLLGPNQRILWDKLDQMCYEYLVGTETLRDKDHYQDLEKGLDFYYYNTKMVSYANMDRSEALRVLRMFIVSNPQYYFLQAMLSGATRPDSGNGGFAFLTINESFADGNIRKAATQSVQAQIDQWMPQILAEPSNLMKEKKIHDLICDKVYYDPNFENVNQNKYNQTAYSVLCTDTTVCAGYSKAMTLFCNAVGIDCVSVTSSNHEWNIVCVDNTWYYTDLTWNDAPEEYQDITAFYEYFNRSYQTYMNDNRENVLAHTTEAIWNGCLPELIYDSGATKTNIGTIHTPVAAVGAPAISCPGSVVTITAPPGASVYYTTDGSNPSAAFTKAWKYTGPFSLSGTTMVKAISVRSGYFDSTITSATITPNYQVTFYANGGYIGSKSTKSISNAGYMYGAGIGKLPGVKRKGYAFLGWYTQKSGGKKISGSTAVTADAAYYARWAKINSKKKAVLSSVKNHAAKSMRIKIKKLNVATGFQIRYSTHQNMKSSKKKDVTENTCIIKKLKKGKTYYVQVRMYQKESVSGKKKYAAWSKTKSVKIKK